MSLSHRARLALPGVSEAVTLNDDFTDNVTDAPELAHAREPLVIGVQEGKRTDYEARLGKRWGVLQRRKTMGTSGVALIWDTQQAQAWGHAVDDPGLAGQGWRPIVGPDAVAIMEVRGVLWRDLRLASGRVLRAATFHRPPLRYKHLWPKADSGLARWMRECPPGLPVLLMMDANQDGGPRPLLDQPGVSWRGVRIDGAVANFRVLSASALPVRRSDHRPVSLAVRVPRMYGR